MYRMLRESSIGINYLRSATVIFRHRDFVIDVKVQEMAHR